MAKTREVTLQVRNDAYTVLLVISLVALITSCILLYVDYATYGSSRPPTISSPSPKVPTDVVPQGVPRAPTGAPVQGNPPGGR